MTFLVVGPRRNTKFHGIWKLFSSSPRKFVIQTCMFCNCQQYLHLFHTVFECIPNIHDQGKMLVLPNRLRTILFHDVQRDIPNERWPYRFRWRGTTGSSMHRDPSHLCRGGRIQLSGHSDLDILIWEISIICEHLPFLLGKKLILRLLLVHRTWQSGDDIHDLGGCHLKCWRFLSVNPA